MFQQHVLNFISKLKICSSEMQQIFQNGKLRLRLRQKAIPKTIDKIDKKLD